MRALTAFAYRFVFLALLKPTYQISVQSGISDLSFAFGFKWIH